MGPSTAVRASRSPPLPLSPGCFISRGSPNNLRYFTTTIASPKSPSLVNSEENHIIEASGKLSTSYTFPAFVEQPVKHSSWDPWPCFSAIGASMANFPNLRRLFIEARSDDEEREVSRKAFYNAVLFMGSVAVFSLIAQRMNASR
ncbi:hypothetical protein F4778DRAFT_690089 [Xylariomycetidae sp. FL2044]|nr:hypothetical protein F4778DRAFT_690089 [Xylariomycetidae sp. FL2044]